MNHFKLNSKAFAIDPYQNVDESKINRILIQTSASNPHQNAAKFLHAPVIRAMLTGNTLQSCNRIEDLLSDCFETRSEDRICQAAARQFATCMKLRQEEEKGCQPSGLSN